MGCSVQRGAESGSAHSSITPCNGSSLDNVLKLCRAPIVQRISASLDIIPWPVLISGWLVSIDSEDSRKQPRNTPNLAVRHLKSVLGELYSTPSENPTWLDDGNAARLKQLTLSIILRTPKTLLSDGTVQKLLKLAGSHQGNRLETSRPHRRCDQNRRTQYKPMTSTFLGPPSASTIPTRSHRYDPPGNCAGLLIQWCPPTAAEIANTA